MVQKQENPTALPGVFSTLAAGFELSTRYLWLMIVPAILDLFLWIGPRLSFRPLIESLAGQLPPQAMPLDLAPLLDMYAARLNHFTYLSVPLLGVPALMTGLTPEKTPIQPLIIERSGMGEWFGYFLLFVLGGLLLAAIRDPDPVIWFEPKRIYRQYKEEVPDDGEALPLDVCFVLREGRDATVVTWGAQVKECLETAELLSAEGIEIEVIDVATLKPLDFDTIHESVRKTGRCVIVHEAPRNGGVGAEIAARLAEEAMFDLVAPVKRVAGYDIPIPLFRLEMEYLPSVKRIAEGVREVMRFR